MMIKIKKKYIIIAIFIVLSVLIGWKIAVMTAPSVIDTNLPLLTLDEISKYDGIQNSEPIYIVYKDLVYDVTAGKEYYQEGGTYNYLAGKDSTSDLLLFGGDIIESKYPVVGRIK